jgi:hypothetical protein
MTPYVGSAWTDAAGNTYVAGSTFTNPHVVTCTDAFVLKYDSAGNHLWTRYRFGAAGITVTSDTSGNVYATGVTQSWSYIDKYNATGVLQQ